MPESQPIPHATFDEGLPPMNRAMMRAAQGDEIVGRVSAAVSSRTQVMNVYESRMSATGKYAAPTIASQHQSAGRRRDGLRRALW